MTPATELTPGTELDGTYRIVERLGEGGMGAVYVAELVRLPKRVALKVLHVAADEGVKARFRREAEIAAKVRHPRVVEVLDYNFLPNGSPYLVMELLDGHDLRHRLAQGPVGADEAVAILADAASALERLHELGIVHRDLKPENIFLAREGDEVRAKVLDFGISKVIDAGTALTADRTVLGTPAYMAPEQVTGENASLDPRTDQFALAAVAYEMLAGAPAFRGDNVMQLFHRILTDPAPSISGDHTRTAADAVLARALAKAKDERYPSVRAFVAALAEALRVDVPRLSGVGPVDAPRVDVLGQTVASGALPAVTPTPAAAEEGSAGSEPPARRRPVVLGALAAAGLVALGAAAFVLLGRQGPAAMEPEPLATAAPAGADEAEPEPAAVPEPEADPDAPAEAVPAAEGTDAPAEAEPEGEAADESPPSKAGPKKVASRVSSGAPTDAEARARLAEAEASLSAGNVAGAIRHANASLQKERSMAARAVLAKAHCARRDLGLAKAMARGLRGPSLSDARRYCREHSLEL
jgi:eukaryotic-like serine/threonine-protein kinase